MSDAPKSFIVILLATLVLQIVILVVTVATSNKYHRRTQSLESRISAEKLQDAVNKIHEPIIQQQLADVQESESTGNIPAIEVPLEPEWQEYTKIMVEMFYEEKYDFARETIEGIYDWVIENQHITEEQISAIQNIKESVE